MSRAGNTIRIRELRAAIAHSIAERAAREAGICPAIRPEIVAELVAHISQGNRKLPTNTAIINLTSAQDCPSLRLGLCPIPEGKCYARKAEQAYPQVLPYRRRQDKITAEMSPLELAAAVGELATRFRVNKLRVSEAGDFRDQTDIEIVTEAARILRAQFKVITYAYTARHDLDYGDCDQIVINSSGPRLNGGSGNQFHAVTDPDFETGIKCHGDCRVCAVCSRAHGRRVVVALH